MRKITNCLFKKNILTLAILIVSACQPGSDTLWSSTDTSQPEELVTPTLIDNSAITTDAPSLPEDGISFEDLRESTPLAPINFRASLSAQGVRLEWDPAPPDDFAHSYSDRIVHYNVYRSSAAEDDLILLAENPLLNT